MFTRPPPGGRRHGGGEGVSILLQAPLWPVPGAALPPVPLCQLRLARPSPRATAGHGKVYNNKMPNWGARERERRESQETLPCHCPEQELNS